MAFAFWSEFNICLLTILKLLFSSYNEEKNNTICYGIAFPQRIIINDVKKLQEKKISHINTLIIFLQIRSITATCFVSLRL